MKKKNMILVGTMVAGISLFTVTTFATGGSNDGYETFKEAMKQTGEVRIGNSERSMLGEFEIVDNGEILLAVSGNVNVQEESELSGGSVFIMQGEVQKELEFYSDKELTIVKDIEADEYYSFDNEDIERDREFGEGKMHERGNWGKEDGHEWSESGENILDAVIGKYKDQFELSETESGSQVVSFDLSKDEVPAVMNLILAEALKNDGAHGMRNEGFRSSPEDLSTFLPFLEGFNFDKEDLPKLTDDVAIERITLSAVLDENKVMTGHSILMVISGKDAAGNAHEIEIKGNMSFVEDTAVDVIDITGKDVQEIVVPNHMK